MFKLLSLSLVGQIQDQLYKIIGSLRLLGSPVGLFSALLRATGRLFSIPMRALGNGTNIMAGMLHGAGEFMHTSLAGVSQSTSSAFANAALVTSWATADDVYRNRYNRLTRAGSVGDGFAIGASTLGSSFLNALSSILIQPIQRGRIEGITGFAKGLGQATLGLVFKPLTGVLGFVSKTTEGLALGVSVVSRLRTPRLLHGPARIIRQYSNAEAIAGQLLRRLEQRDRSRGALVAMVDFNSHQLMLTDTHVMCVAVRQSDVVWCYAWKGNYVYF